MKIFCLSLLFASLFASLSVAQTPLTLALNWKAEPQFGGFYEPGLKDDFQKLGLDLKVLQGGSGTPTIQMLANGQVDMAVVSSEEILLNNDKNPQRQVLALFAVFQTNPQILMCRPENHFKSLTEVMNSDATISLQSGLSYAQFLRKKFPQTKTHWVPYLGGISSFLNEKNFCQQGFFSSEPLLARGKGLDADVFLVAQEGFNPYTTVLAIRVADKARWPLDKIIQAVRASWNRYLAESQKTNELMASINKSMDRKTFLESAKAQQELILPAGMTSTSLGQMSEFRWQELIEQMLRLKLIKTPQKARAEFF